MENLLLTKDCTLKICDFGECYVPGQFEDTRIPGTPIYRAPDKDLTKPLVDSYSSGIVAFMMCTGEFPFLDYDDDSYKEFHADPIKMAEERGLEVSPELLTMVAGLTHHDIKKRFDL